MIITKLIGGLGNQMFQYAAGLSLAVRQDVPLLLDLTCLRVYDQHHGYQLNDVFRGDFQIAGKLDLFRVMSWRAGKAARSGAAISPDWPRVGDDVWVRQRSQNYDHDFERIGRRCYLSGYWQSSKYFANVKTQIREAFRFREPLAGTNAEIAKRIGEMPSVAIHIRRGDYVNVKHVTEFHGICDWDYYDDATAHMKRIEPDARFFVFSDDIGAVRARFAGHPSFEIVATNAGMHSYRDMMLMSQCKHQIIANSTFSWWAAWLNSHSDKTVIAPSRWFAGSTERIVDIYCNDWVVI